MNSFLGLREKEVINAIDGKRLGVICDLEIEECQGRITAIVLPGPCKFFGLIRGDRDYVIPWNRIRKIGKDVILVDVDDACLRTPYDWKNNSV